MVIVEIQEMERALDEFKAAVERGEIPADTKVEVALDLLYGPLYHRLLHGHAPLTQEFAATVVNVVVAGLGGI